MKDSASFQNKNLTSKRSERQIEWIGEIPEDWKKRRLKYLCSITNGDEDTQNADSDGEYPFYVRSPNIERCTRYTFNGEGILVAGDGAGAGRIFHHAYGKYAVHQRVYILYDFKCNTIFLHYYLSNTFPNEMDRGSAQSTVPSMRLPMLLNFQIFLPSTDTQKSIADFLDSKCAKIDSLKNDIEKQIETLEQYKKSIITEAVTKGINPNVKMKDSGIDDVTKTPETWEEKKIKFLFDLVTELNHLPMDKVQLLSLYTDLGVFPHGEQEERGNKAVTVEGYKKVKKNDLVVNIILAWMGAMGISKYDGVTSPAYDIYRPKSENVNPKFYHYLFRTPWFAGECDKYGRGIMKMRWRTYSQEFMNIKIPYPSAEEQKNIADYLDSKCSAIDRIISTKKQQLEKLEEYKKSLIFEYVTGKKLVSSCEFSNENSGKREA